MMKTIIYFYRALLVVISLIRTKQSLPKGVREVNETYTGVNNETVPLKVFYPQKPAQHTLIIFPGASPFAEEHPGMILIGRALARAGYLSFVPRIPLLKDLILSDEILTWMVRFYEWTLSRSDVDSDRISLIGMSFGGALVLKLSLDTKIKKQPPKSILVYGTYYDIDTAFRFLLTGKMEVNGNEYYIQPNEWGVIVLFHNYLSKVDVGYSTENVCRLLKLRVKDLQDEIETEKEKLNGKERQLLDAILTARATPEILRIKELIWKECKSELESSSPKNWCNKISTKVFVMHGANDSMAPFTESIKLAAALKNSSLLISYLYEHREISTEKGVFFRIKEFLRILRFMYEFIQYNEH